MSTSAPRRQILDPREWSRVGGRELQFFATDDEVRGYLNELPSEFGPYDTLGSTLLPNPGGSPPYRSEPYVCAIDEHFERLARGMAIPSNIFVRPAALVPALPIADGGRDIDAWCTVNGVVLLQHGWTRSGKREASRIAICDKMDSAAGQRIHLKEQAKVFDHLKRRIRRDLKFASIRVYKGGIADESTHQMMTSAAAELAKTGFFVSTPGRMVR
jgi:hypothetical protein